jgi:hypothetical protein
MDSQAESSSDLPTPSMQTVSESAPAGSEGFLNESNLALSMYSSASNNNNHHEIPDKFLDIYLVAINNGAEEEYAGRDLMFLAIFENDGSKHQRSDMNEKNRRKCNEEFKIISLHVVLKNKAVIRATVRLKGTCNLFFDDPEDARDYVEKRRYI